MRYVTAIYGFLPTSTCSSYFGQSRLDLLVVEVVERMDARELFLRQATSAEVSLQFGIKLEGCPFGTIRGTAAGSTLSPEQSTQGRNTPHYTASCVA